jgi:saccharopine dehydrogenase-like NADP-dependent oxidoreductase
MRKKLKNSKVQVINIKTLVIKHSGEEMRFLVLGCGMQGRAVAHDLSNNPEVKEIVCVDKSFERIEGIKDHLDMSRIRLETIDFSSRDSLTSLLKHEKNVDVLIDMLPARFAPEVSRTAVEIGVDLVNARYAQELPRDIAKNAVEKGITIMPEAGLDPGIDLILSGYGVSAIDDVYELHSMCGGFPAPQSIDNPLKYKIAWNFEDTLRSYRRGGRVISDGMVLEIPPEAQFDAEWLETVEVEGIGKLESFPNGDAVRYLEDLGIKGSIKDASRRTLRWPGHCDTWRALVALDFLSENPVPGLSGSISPFQFMVKHLEPRLQYKPQDEDLVVMRVIVGGVKDGRRVRNIFDLVDRRDLKTGLFAMNGTTGYTASITAQMIAKGVINRHGVLSPAKDIPYEPFLEELKKRGVRIRRTEIIEEG